MVLSWISGHEGRACRCSECRWPSPNPNPCPKKSLSHKNKCGTIEGYELSTSERQTHSNASESDDDEHLSDDDPHSQGNLSPLLFKDCDINYYFQEWEYFSIFFVCMGVLSY